MPKRIQLSRRRRALLMVVAPVIIAPSARADVIDATWLGGNGSWNDALMWSGGVVPNNSGSITFRAVVPTGSVVGTGSIALDSLQLGSPASVRLDSLFTSAGGEVNGLLTMIGGYTTAAPVTGTGTIDLGIIPSTSSLRGTGSLEIGSGLTVRIKRYNGSIRSGGAGPLINRGHIIGGDWDWSFAPFLSGGSIQNLGVIEAQNGALHLNSTFTRADLGELRWSNGGTMSIEGTLLNEGQTLEVDAAHAWGCIQGTIRGGVIHVASDTRMSFGSEFTNSVTHLDDVIVNGPIWVSNDVLTVDRGVLAGNADVLLATRYIARSPRVVSGTSTLSINSTVRIHGGGAEGFGVGIGEANQAVVNHGTVGAEFNSSQPNPGGNLNVSGSSVFNDGTLGADLDAVLALDGGFNQPTQLTFGDGGALEIAMSSVGTNSGLLQVRGVLDLSTLSDRLILSGGQPNAVYHIVATTAGISGEFNSVSPGYELTYAGNDIYARHVPEPGAAAPIILLATLARLRRTRRGARDDAPPMLHRRSKIG